MSIRLNKAEVDALVRNLDGLTDDGNPEPIESVTIERRDSLDNAYAEGFLIVHIDYVDGGFSEDAISEIGSTSFWRAKGENS